MAARAVKPPRFYFNLRSPYNFFALHDLRLRRPEVLDRLEWRPFWEPDPVSSALLPAKDGEFPFVPMTRAKQFYILRDVRRLAADRGLKLTWPVDASPWWEPAHLTWFLAEREGLGQRWVERASRARWLEGLDICDPATVTELGTQIGLDAAEVAAAADNPVLREAGAAALRDVVRDGVFGVPYFVNGREPFWGLDRLDAFLASLPERPAGATGPAAAPEPTAVRELSALSEPVADRPAVAPFETFAPLDPPVGDLGPALAAPGADLGHAGGCG